MSTIVCYIILVLEFSTGVWCVYRTFKYLYNQSKKSKSKMPANKNMPNILIVIPCLREQDIIIETLKHFLKMTSNLNNVKLLVVTTQKEEFEKEENLYLKEQLIKDVKNNMQLQKV